MKKLTKTKKLYTKLTFLLIGIELGTSLALDFSYNLSVNINIPFDELNLDFDINITWHCSYLLKCYWVGSIQSIKVYFDGQD